MPVECYLDLDSLIMALPCVFVLLTVSATGRSGESSAQVTKLPERDGELVGEPVVVLASFWLAARRVRTMASCDLMLTCWFSGRAARPEPGWASATARSRSSSGAWAWS